MDTATAPELSAAVTSALVSISPPAITGIPFSEKRLNALGITPGIISIQSDLVASIISLIEPISFESSTKNR